jgi:Xaa-Pro aminopeptidase
MFAQVIFHQTKKVIERTTFMITTQAQTTQVQTVQVQTVQVQTVQAQRIEGLRARFSKYNIDALLVTHVPHVAYLTGFSGSSAMLLITPTDTHFLTDGRYGKQAKAELMQLPQITLHVEREWWKYITEQSLLAGAKSVGFEAAHTSVLSAEAIKKRFENIIPMPVLQPLAGFVESVTMCKTRSEVDSIRAAADIAAKVFDHVLRTTTFGMTENDVAAEVAYMSKKFGSEGEGFETIVASGIRGALPHGRASHKPLQMGELITLDFGCRVNGFYSDMTRTFALGEPSAFDRSIYHLVLEANQASIQAARGGMKVVELDAVARAIITKAGYEKEFEHGLGHGLGKEVHEKPSISWRFPEEVAPVGAVITIEPGVYIAGRCGVRIEDDVWLTETGCEVLTASTPKELIVV